MVQTAASSPRMVDVLVIDGDPSIREEWARTLTSAGLRAQVADDGAKGLAMAEESHPAVVLLDLRLPERSGFDVIERLRALDPQAVLIVASAQTSVDEAVLAMKLGAFDLVGKPLTQEALTSLVQRALARHGSLVASAAPVAAKSREDLLLDGLDLRASYRELGLEGTELESTLASLEAEAARTGSHETYAKATRALAADLRTVDAIIEENEFRKNALIQILLGVQRAFNYLPAHAIDWISRRLNVPAARIYRIGEFYEALSLVPQGKHTVQICAGTSCHVCGASNLTTLISSVLGIAPGETDEDLLFTLRTVNCLGCCALAPVVKIDEQYYSNPDRAELQRIFESHGKEFHTP